jgi:hypothetical protein
MPRFVISVRALTAPAQLAMRVCNSLFVNCAGQSAAIEYRFLGPCKPALAELHAAVSIAAAIAVAAGCWRARRAALCISFTNLQSTPTG